LFLGPPLSSKKPALLLPFFLFTSSRDPEILFMFDITMSDYDRKEPFDEKASASEVDLAVDPDAGLSEAEKQEAVSCTYYITY
jgi:hypothetical protein